MLPSWRKPKFFAWGHRTGGNNCTKADAARALAGAWEQITEETPYLGMNNKFDLDVAETHFGLQFPDWRLNHDVMYLLFLKDPHARELKLKPSAEKYLGLPPDEQDAVKDWVLTHKKQLEKD